MRELKGKNVLITGAARGIGLALARGFAECGARVQLADVDRPALERARRSVAAAGPSPAIHTLDVAEPAAIAAFPGLLHGESGPIDVLVNNAGVVFGGAFLDVDLEQHLRTYRVNLLGLVALTRALLPDLISRPEAHLVNVASAAGFVGLPYGATYASSKWGVIGFSESLRQELKIQGHAHVHVTTVCPGFVRTGLFTGARPPWSTRELTPERLTALTLRAVRRNRPYVLTPWLVRMSPFVQGALPTWLSERISDFLGVTTSMRDWRGRDPSR